MGLLWTFQDCRRWLKNRYPEVRLWAAGRLENFFPREAGPLMAALLEDEEKSVAVRATSYFVRWPDRKFADSLLRVFQSSQGAPMDYCAQGLVRLGDGRFIPIFLDRYAAKSIRLLGQIGTLDAMMELKSPQGIEIIRQLLEKADEGGKKEEPRENLEDLVSLCASLLLRCQRPEEITYLLKYYLASPRREEWGYLILAAFVARANSRHSREMLEEGTARKVLRLSPIEKDEIDRLANSGAEARAKSVEKLLKKKRYVETIDLLSQAAEELFKEQEKTIGELAMREWEKKESQPLINLWLLRALAGELPQIKQSESSIQRRHATTALLIYSKLWECREFIGASLERMSTEKKLALLLEDREELAEDDRLIDLLAGEESPAGMSQACLRKIEKGSGSVGAERAVRLLGRRGDAQAIPALLSLLQNQEDVGISGLAEEALLQIGEPVLPFLATIVREGKAREVSAVLPLVGCLAYPAAVELILFHFGRLYETDRESLLYALEELGSARFIPLLRTYLKEDEPEEEVFSLLCRIHEIDDPELPRIAQALARRKEESKERMARLAAGDERAVVREKIPLPLRCAQCHLTYTYSVQEVLVDQDDREMQGIYIRDPIICKHCGAEDKHEITSKARLAVTFNLMAMLELHDAGKAALNEGPVKVAGLRVAGKRMGPKEGLAYYQEEVAKHPDRADLRVGYGNLLLFWKKEAQARAEFEKAMDLDPFAVEAIYALARMEVESGRLHEACSLYGKCLEVFERGHFYRMEEEKRELFREQVESALWDLQEELRIKQSQLPSRETGQPRLVKKEKEKVGRNAPCPCGSGKKYKRCCLAKEEVKISPSTPITMVTEEEDRLSKRLVSFAGSSRFKREFAEAASLFFHKPASEPAEGSHDEAEFTQFIEWFIHDYPLAEGSTVIEEFARGQGKSIPPKERELLLGWLESTISLFEVQEVSPERAEIRVKDLFTQKEILIRDVSGSRQLVKWDLIATRILAVGGQMRPAASFFSFRPHERESLTRFLNERWEQHRKNTGEDRWEAFMKAKGYLFYHYTLSREAESQPPLLTPEYHDLVFCKALYEVENFYAALYQLRQEADFHLEEGGEGEKKAQFAWLKRGRSKDIVPEGTKKGQGLVIQSALLFSPASRGATSLGTLALTERRLTLETLSRERLEAGKRRIEMSVGPHIRFRADSFESVKAGLERRQVAEKEEKESPAIPLEEKEAMLKRFFSRHLEDWLQTSIPALDGKSPLDMVRLPGGKERVEQLLKQMENMEERKRREGEIYADIGALRKKLGLPLSSKTE